MNSWDQFTGANAGYVLELFERYQQDPASVDDATRATFRTFTPPADPTPTAAPAADTAERDWVFAERHSRGEKQW